MPYASKAQARKFHADPKLRRYAAEYDRATGEGPGFANLPERSKSKPAMRKATRKKVLKRAAQRTRGNRGRLHK